MNPVTGDPVTMKFCRFRHHKNHRLYRPGNLINLPVIEMVCCNGMMIPHLYMVGKWLFNQTSIWKKKRLFGSSRVVILTEKNASKHAVEESSKSPKTTIQSTLGSAACLIPSIHSYKSWLTEPEHGFMEPKWTYGVSGIEHPNHQLKNMTIDA